MQQVWPICVYVICDEEKYMTKKKKYTFSILECIWLHPYKNQKKKNSTELPYVFQASEIGLLIGMS